ncbi:MAG TPA: hypothetical protein VF812_10525 [Ktedonobacterales bacterium]
MKKSLWGVGRLSRRSVQIIAAVTLVAVLGAVAGGLFYLHQKSYAAGAGCDVGSNQGTPTCTFHGLTAFASFDSLSADGCIDTFALVLASTGFENYPSYQMDRGSSVQVQVGQYDNCNQAPIVFATGLQDNVNFVIDKSLGTATLDTTVNVSDLYTQASYPVRVNLTWQGYGDTTHTISTIEQHSYLWSFNFHYNGDLRSAQATGSISSDSIADYTAAAPATNAYLVNGGGGVVYAFHWNKVTQ